VITRIDNVATLPAYAAAGTAVLAFLVDLIAPARRGPVMVVTGLGAAATAVVAWAVGSGGTRGSFCTPATVLPAVAPGAVALPGTSTVTTTAVLPGTPTATCSLLADHSAALVAVVFALLTLGVVALSAPALRPSAATLPAGEYCFLLACSMTGGVVLGYAHDLITLVIAVETLTLPLYGMVALRRRSIARAEGAVVFFVVSVVSGAVTLLGAALLYAVTGNLYFEGVAAALAGDAHARGLPLTNVAVVLLVSGLAFKVAAVPFHAWAPATYDGAPTPVAAYLSTASKVGGVIAILYASVRALGPSLDIAGPVLAGIAALTMTVGNLVALRQDRMVRLLAWSSVAQSGYILAPLGVFALAGGRTPEAIRTAVAATVAYTVFYVVLELGAFGCVIAWRGAADGGRITDYRGFARRAPWLGAAFVLALVGLAGLPPGLAGLFAKVVIIKALGSGGAWWLALVVAVNAVIGLAYYARVAATLFAPADLVGASDATPAGTPARPARPFATAWSVVAALAVVTTVGLVIGFAPQLVLHLADIAAGR
jgi:NADH-quinone oxidoreductase subunit N